MSIFSQTLLQSRIPLCEARRFLGRMNIRRPKRPQYERQLLLDVSKPFFKIPPKNEADNCTVGKQYPWTKVIENPFEAILARECLNWFNNSKVVIFLHMNSINMEEKTKIYVALRKQGMHLRTYGKKIVRMATQGTHLEAVNQLFVSHQDIIFSYSEDVGKMFKILKKAPQMVVMAGIVNNQLLSKTELVAYSKLPDLKMAQAQLCSVLTSAASNVVSQLTQHQQLLVSHLDQHAKQLGELSKPIEKQDAVKETESEP